MTMAIGRAYDNKSLRYIGNISGASRIKAQPMKTLSKAMPNNGFGYPGSKEAQKKMDRQILGGIGKKIQQSQPKPQSLIGKLRRPIGY